MLENMEKGVAKQKKLGTIVLEEVFTLTKQ